MDRKTASKILLAASMVHEQVRAEFFQIEQRKSNYSPAVFYSILINICNTWDTCHDLSRNHNEAEEMVKSWPILNRLYDAAIAEEYNVHLPYDGLYSSKKEVDPNLSRQSSSIPQTLFDIWQPDYNGEKKCSYDDIIQRLKNDCIPDQDCTFLTEIHGQLHWAMQPKKGWVQYLAGFIYVCIEKRWILNKYSAPTYGRILGATFNIQFDDAPFKNLNIDEKYLKPFENYPVNIPAKCPK